MPWTRRLAKSFRISRWSKRTIRNKEKDLIYNEEEVALLQLRSEIQLPPSRNHRKQKLKENFLHQYLVEIQQPRHGFCSALKKKTCECVMSTLASSPCDILHWRLWSFKIKCRALAHVSVRTTSTSSSWNWRHIQFDVPVTSNYRPCVNQNGNAITQHWERRRRGKKCT